MLPPVFLIFLLEPAIYSVETSDFFPGTASSKAGRPLEPRVRWWCHASDDDDQLTGLTTAGGDAGNAHPAVLQPMGVETLVELQRPAALGQICFDRGGAASGEPASGDGEPVSGA